MRHAQNPVDRLGFLIRTISTLVGACLLAGLLVSPASATHFRYGQISWTQAGGNSVNVSVQQGWRRNATFITCIDITTFASIPCTHPSDLFVNIGDVVAPFSAPLQWGDGSPPTTLFIKVTSIDLDRNWFFGVALDPASFPAEVNTLPHTYAAPGPYIASFESCCRLSPPVLINNSDGGFSVETVINAGGLNNSPVTALPPIVLCPIGGLCGFFVPGADPEGDPLNYRLSTSLEADRGLFTGFIQPGPPDAPNAASIDMNTGLYTWDAAGAAGMLGDFYSTQVTIEDADSKVAVDFLIQLSAAADLHPPTIVGTVVGSSDLVCGAANAQTVDVGDNLMFGIVASDEDDIDALTLNVAALPVGASMTPPLPLAGMAGADVSSTFSWTPTLADHGTTIVTYNVSNFRGGFALCAVTIKVNAVPVAVDDPGFEANSGETINIDVLVNDTGLEDGVAMITATSASDATLEVVGTAPNLSIDYTSDDGFGLTDTFTYTITDTDGEVSNSATVTIEIDGSISETPPNSSNKKIFGGTLAGVAIAAVGDFTADGGQSRLICGLVPDPRVFLKKGVIRHRPVKFDIGLAKNAIAAFNDTPTLLEGELVISKFVHVHTEFPNELDPAKFVIGLCFVDTFFWEGAISVDVDAEPVVGYSVKCKPNLGINRQPVTFARATSPPELAKLMRPISTQCDPRGVAKWSQSWILVNGQHVAAKSPSQSYTHGMSALLKNLISAMQDDGAIVSTDPLSGDVFSLVLAAEVLFKEQRESATLADIELAMSFLDDASILALAPPTPGLPYVSTPRFDNPKGELVSHLTALRYAVCSEIALGLAPSGSDLSLCVMRADVVLALPTL